MFGYVVAHKPELRMREFYKYKAYYCGLCKVLREKYGFLGQLTLTYDMTFLVILLTSLYEKETNREEHRCIVHPTKKQKMLYNEITEYAADMNMILTYYKLVDDWEDERSKVGFVGKQAYKKAVCRLEEKYPEKCKVIRSCLELLHQCEERSEENLDIVARCFGELMGELFVYKKDVWEETLREIGFYLGKFIYILDAYDDVEKDIEKNNYNALIALSKKEDFDEKCEEMLNFVLAECSHRFEKLPCVEDVEILRNILYAGVWDKFNQKRMKKDGE
jgi:hypothetical protein